MKQILLTLLGYIGRILQKKPPILKPAYLNLCCGYDHFTDFINADFFKARFWKRPINSWCLDLRYPLKCDNNFFDGVFSEHTIEHITREQAYNLLRELHRTMKQGTYIRIIVPDLNSHLREEDVLRSLENLTMNHGHKSIWNARGLMELLRKTGFRDVRRVSYLSGSDKNIIKDTEKRKHLSIYIEGKK